MDWKHLNLEYEPRYSIQLDRIKMLASSMSMKEIAANQEVHYRSVMGSVQTLYRKTGARDRFELCIWAVKKGYVNI